MKTIIHPQSLVTHLHETNLLIIDVRPLNDYQHAHIPGAVHFDIRYANLTMGQVSGLLPPAEDFALHLVKIGADQQKQLVIYDNDGGPSAGRLVFTLAAYGHPNATMLDGGIHAWLAQGQRIETESVLPVPTRGKFHTNYKKEFVADKNEILNKLGTPGIVLLDVRSAEEYTGQVQRSAQGGHIPGAINLDWNLTKDREQFMRFKSPDVLQKMLENKGITPDKEIITYCQTHQRSALMWVLLKNLGYPNVKGYPGAWSDWGNCDTAPIERN